jgi:hypothetical protein
MSSLLADAGGCFRSRRLVSNIVFGARRCLWVVKKHEDAQINLDLHQFLKSDSIKKLEPEAKYNSLREHFSEHWGPHSSFDVTKIKQELTKMQGDDPG